MLYQQPKYSELRDKIVADKAKNRRNASCISSFFNAAITDFGRKDAYWGLWYSFLEIGDENSMEERRKHRRVLINKRVWICDFDETTSPAKPKDCLMVDISEGGACIQCSARYKEGQPIAFTYQDFIEEGLRPVMGTVMWSRQHSETDYRYGIQFLGLSTQMLHRIQDIVIQTADGMSGPNAE